MKTQIDIYTQQVNEIIFDDAIPEIIECSNDENTSVRFMDINCDDIKDALEALVNNKLSKCSPKVSSSNVSSKPQSRNSFNQIHKVWLENDKKEDSFTFVENFNQIKKRKNRKKRSNKNIIKKVSSKKTVTKSKFSNNNVIEKKVETETQYSTLNSIKQEVKKKTSKSIVNENFNPSTFQFSNNHKMKPGSTEVSSDSISEEGKRSFSNCNINGFDFFKSLSPNFNNFGNLLSNSPLFNTFSPNVIPRGGPLYNYFNGCSPLDNYTRNPGNLTKMSFTPGPTGNNTFFSKDIPQKKGGKSKRGQTLDDACKQINFENILMGIDKRTTLMIRHIPNKYTLKSMLEDINSEFKGKYDLFYLPIDYVNNCNLGFAFINFVDPMHILYFYETYRGRKWKKFNSEKICELVYAKYQGKKELVAHFEKGSVLTNQPEDRKPLILDHLKPLPKVEIPVHLLQMFLYFYPNAHYRMLRNKFQVIELY